MRNKIVIIVMALTLAASSCGSPDSEEATVSTELVTAAAPAVPALNVSQESRIVRAAQRTAYASMLATFYEVATWNTTVRWIDAARWVEAAAAYEADLARARAAAAAEDRDRRRSAKPAPTAGGSGRCGGNLPPCSVMECESGGDPTAQNPNSSASGKWQVIDSTWAGYGGYPTAASAPESVQDAFAAELYAGGAGRSHWVC